MADDSNNKPEQRFYNVTEYYNGQFYQLQKSLFKGKYKILNNNARVVYSILKERFSVSIKNNWIDKNGNIFFYFEQAALAVEACVSIRTITTLIDVLEEIGLIYSLQQGMNKPNMLYLLKPENEISVKAAADDEGKEQSEKDINKQSKEKGALDADKQRTRKNCASGHAKIALLDTQKLRTSNTNIKKIKDNNNLSINHKESKDAIDTYKEVINSNIDYDKLCEKYPLHKEYFDELVELILDTVCSSQKTIRINGDNMNADIVKKQLIRLNQSHIEYVMDCLSKNTTAIKNIKSYILTTLYNAPMTISHKYQSQVMYDWYGAGHT